MSKKNVKTTKKPIKARNWTAVAAIQRHAGPMHDRRDPRGGDRNLQAEYLDEAICESCGDTATPDSDREIAGSLLFICDTCHSPRA